MDSTFLGLLNTVVQKCDISQFIFGLSFAIKGIIAERLSSSTSGEGSVYRVHR